MAGNAPGKRACKTGNNLKVMTNLEITELEREDDAAWDAYVHNSPAYTFYHQLRSVLIKLFKSLMWRNVVEKIYKHKPIYRVSKKKAS